MYTSIILTWCHTSCLSGASYVSFGVYLLIFLMCLSGIQGAKHTSLLIPLCHNILLSKVAVDLELDPELQAIKILAEARTVGPTGEPCA